MKKSQFFRNIGWINSHLSNKHQLSLADYMNWSDDMVVSLECGEAPTLDQLSALHLSFGLSFQELIESDLSQSDSKFIEGSLEKNKKDVLTEYTFFEIPLNPQKAGAGSYSAVRQEAIEGKNLAKICVPAELFPELDPEKLKAFEIEGNSMHPSVRSGDVVIANKLDSIYLFEEGTPHILILKDRSVFFKRLFKVRDEPDKIQMSSDNPDFPQLLLGLNLISECWKVCHHLKSSDF